MSLISAQRPNLPILDPPPPRARHRVLNKPLLLLTIIDRFAQGLITAN